jgi:hypothetical protein
MLSSTTAAVTRLLLLWFSWFIAYVRVWFVETLYTCRVCQGYRTLHRAQKQQLAHEYYAAHQVSHPSSCICCQLPQWLWASTEKLSFSSTRSFSYVNIKAGSTCFFTAGDCRFTRHRHRSVFNCQMTTYHSLMSTCIYTVTRGRKGAVKVKTNVWSWLNSRRNSPSADMVTENSLEYFEFIDKTLHCQSVSPPIGWRQ